MEFARFEVVYACILFNNNKGGQSEKDDIKSDAFREAYLQCSNTIQNMEKELRSACHAPGTKVDSVFKVFDELLSIYEATCHGPEKWRKVVMFLQQSLEGSLLDISK
ncbi:Guanylate-binding family protein [Forsythia ovata]|uniref:Guanylate-binding family protein n=1 Tax=Forsythia ovata TaxID=205694 RepID=A0ABD1P1D3_9LAMI